MKVKVEFECEVYSINDQTWFKIYDEIEHTRLDCVQNFKVFDAETGEEV